VELLQVDVADGLPGGRSRHHRRALRRGPRTQTIPGFDIESGFIHTDDGALIAGEPEVAANWYPVNDHPLDKASYTFEVTVPAGLQVIANGRLVDHRTKAGNTTLTWEAREPMASYLATASVGHYALHSYQAGGL
jgi:hypothetical protein